jgi:hypothetical protein
VECKNKSNTSSNRGNRNHLKSFRRYLSNIPGKHGITELQKTVIFGTAHILRKVLKTFFMGSRIICAINRNHGIASQECAVSIVRVESTQCGQIRRRCRRMRAVLGARSEPVEAVTINLLKPSGNFTYHQV